MSKELMFHGAAVLAFLLFNKHNIFHAQVITDKKHGRLQKNKDNILNGVDKGCVRYTARSYKRGKPKTAQKKVYQFGTKDGFQTDKIKKQHHQRGGLPNKTAKNGAFHGSASGRCIMAARFVYFIVNKRNVGKGGQYRIDKADVRHAVWENKRQKHRKRNGKYPGDNDEKQTVTR